jgi:hypothetical protein
MDGPPLFFEEWPTTSTHILEFASHRVARSQVTAAQEPIPSSALA